MDLMLPNITEVAARQAAAAVLVEMRRIVRVMEAAQAVAASATTSAAEANTGRQLLTLLNGFSTQLKSIG